MRGDSWGPRQHTGPLNEKNDQLSPPLLKTHLHPVRSHYGLRPVPGSCRTALSPPARWPSSYQADPAHRSAGHLILPCQGFLASLLSSFFFLFFTPLLLTSIFHSTFGVLLAERAIIRVPETSLLLFYTITVQCAHLKASAERIRGPAKC